MDGDKDTHSGGDNTIDEGRDSRVTHRRPGDSKDPQQNKKLKVDKTNTSPTWTSYSFLRDKETRNPQIYRAFGHPQCASSEDKNIWLVRHNTRRRKGLGPLSVLALVHIPVTCGGKREKGEAVCIQM